MRLRNTMHSVTITPLQIRITPPSHHTTGCGDSSLVSYDQATLTVISTNILHHSPVWHLPVTVCLPLGGLSSITTLKTYGGRTYAHLTGNRLCQTSHHHRRPQSRSPNSTS